MRKVIAAINMSLDGIIDHTSMIATDEIHDHYSNLINNSGAMLLGRITYHLMEYWRTILTNPTGDKAMDDFAVAIDRIPKTVFSNTLKNIEWNTARLATEDIKAEVLELREQPGKDILVGSRSLIISLLNLNMIDEFQLIVHPAIIGNGLRLFDNIQERIDQKLVKTKFLESSGSMLFYFEPIKK